MYVKFSANTTDAGGLVNYLSKEDTLVRDQLESIEQDPAFNGYVQGYVSYLTKEDRPEHKEYFFNDKWDMIEGDEVTMKIGGNCKGLKHSENHFYMMTLSPSERELAHLRQVAKAQVQILQPGASVTERSMWQEMLFRNLLKEHTCHVMDEYAKHFGREGIESANDLVWYGKVEKDRYWKHDSPEVIHNRRVFSEIRRLERSGAKHSQIKKIRSKLIYESQVRQGGAVLPIYENMPKSGLNYHVHVMVSRRDAAQKVSLSPLAKQRSSPNHKINGVECKVGFDRDAFAQKVERAFDSKFQYLRGFGETYEGRKLAKSNPELYREARVRYNREHGIVSPARVNRSFQERLARTAQARAVNNVAKGILGPNFIRIPGLSLATQLMRGRSERVKEIAKTNPQLARKLARQQMTRQIARHVAKGAIRTFLSTAGLSIPGLNVALLVAKGISSVTKSKDQGQEQER